MDGPEQPAAGSLAGKRRHFWLEKRLLLRQKSASKPQHRFQRSGFSVESGAASRTQLGIAMCSEGTHTG